MDQEFGSWRVEGLPRRIEYSLAVLEELRVYADEGFQKIPHGGIEVARSCWANTMTPGFGSSNGGRWPAITRAGRALRCRPQTGRR